MATIPATTFYWQQVNLGDTPNPANWTLDADGVFSPTVGLRYLVKAFGESTAIAIINDTTLVMSVVSNRSMDEGTTSTFTPTISAGTNPVFSITGPAWATVNPSTGLVTLTPPTGGSAVGVNAVTVSATNTCNTASQIFDVTVASVVVAVPVNTALPAITGTTEEGQTLTASTGTWTNSPTGHAYQWRRSGVNISGATASTYVLGAADVGATLTVRVTASNAGGASAPATSAATGTITAVPGATAPAAFTIGQWTLADSPSIGGDTLTINITALPSNGGASITALQYTLNGGSSWTALSGTGTGARNITVLASTLASVAIRAVNAMGNGTASDTKTATPTTSGAVIGAAATTFATAPTIHYHVHSATMLNFSDLPAQVGDRVKSIVDIRGLANATQATEAQAPILEQDAAGRKYLNFRSGAWMAVDNALTGLSSTASTILMHARSHRSRGYTWWHPRYNGAIGTVNAADNGAFRTAVSGGHGYLGIGTSLSTSGAQSDVTNRKHMIPCANESVFGMHSTASNVTYRYGGRKATSAGATSASANRIGAIIGGTPSGAGAVDISGNDTGMSLYEFVMWKALGVVANFDAAADAMVSNWQTVDFTDQILLEGDSITEGNRKPAPSDNGNWSDLNLSMVMTEPGALLVPTTCRVLNVASGGSTVGTVAAQNGGNSVWARANSTLRPWNEKLTGENVVILQIGANDVASTTAAALYPNYLALLTDTALSNNGVDPLGFLPSGWSVAVAVNVINGTSVSAATRTTDLRALLVANIINDAGAGVGGAYEGKVSLIRSDLVTVTGVGTIFEDDADADNNVYWLKDNTNMPNTDKLHPSALGTRLMVTGADTPVNGYVKAVSDFFP